MSRRSWALVAFAAWVAILALAVGEIDRQATRVATCERALVAGEVCP